MHTEATITCPKCGANLPLTEAVAHRFREEIAREFQQKFQFQTEALAEREKKILASQKDLATKTEQFDAELKRRLESQRQALFAEALKQSQEKVNLDLTDLRAQLNEKAAKLKEAQTAELELRKQKRELEEQKAALKLEVARTLELERESLLQKARANIADEFQLRMAEKDKKNQELCRQIEALKQKAEQGSQQLQGEVLETALEDQLRAHFIFDLIEPVAKGQRGGDVLHRVRTNTGMDCGAILWETKRTKNWGRDWPVKLKDDQREVRAEIAVIVSEALPDELRNFGPLDGIWVCEFACALPLAAALRQGLIATSAARHAESGKQTKMDQLYNYLAGTEFRQRIEALVEAFRAMKKDLDDEKRAFARRWAAREKQLEQAVTNTAALYGGIHGIVGQSVLPELTVFQLEAPES